MGPRTPPTATILHRTQTRKRAGRMISKLVTASQVPEASNAMVMFLTEDVMEDGT